MTFLMVDDEKDIEMLFRATEFFTKPINLVSLKTEVQDQLLNGDGQ